MRILYASERPPYPFFLGGAARCAHRLLQALTQDLGVQCEAVGSSDYRTTPWSYPDAADHAALDIRSVNPERRGGGADCGYPIRLFPDFANALKDFIQTFRPDIVWAQLEGAKPVLELARDSGVQGLLFVHDAESDPAELRTIADMGCHVVCSSSFLARKTRTVIGRPAHVVYPCPETNFGVYGDSRGSITMINPHRVKGVETFIEIAKLMPSEKFLLVESWKLTDEGVAALEQALAGAPNVRFLRRVSDMRRIYGQTKLLLVPSVWEEGFGMVAVEAQSCRIPVIASGRGGLPESVGDGGLLVDDHLDARAWVGAIGNVLDSDAHYASLAAQAARHATGDTFSVATSARRFHAACMAKAPPQGILFRGMRALVENLDAIPGLSKRVRAP